jgi:hypothetical protein
MFEAKQYKVCDITIGRVVVDVMDVIPAPLAHATKAIRIEYDLVVYVPGSVNAFFPHRYLPVR